MICSFNKSKAYKQLQTHEALLLSFESKMHGYAGMLVTGLSTDMLRRTLMCSLTLHPWDFSAMQFCANQ